MAARRGSQRERGSARGRGKTWERGGGKTWSQVPGGLCCGGWKWHRYPSPRRVPVCACTGAHTRTHVCMRMPCRKLHFRGAVISVELLRHFCPVMLTAFISWQGGQCCRGPGRGSVLGVPRAGRTGAGQRGLSVAVAEAALKFLAAFELLVKILEIGGLWTVLAGRALYGALFAGVTSGQAGMCSHGMEPISCSHGCAVPCHRPACSSPAAVAFQQGARPFPPWFNTQDRPALPYPRALVPSHPHVRNSHGLYIFYSLLKEHCRVKNRVS